MKKIITGIVISVLAFYTTGCSTVVYKESRKQIIERRAEIADIDVEVDEKGRIIQAREMAGGGVGVGVDFLQPNFWETLKEQPGKQIGAALLDAAALYGSYVALDSLSNDGSSGRKNNTSGAGGNVSGRDTIIVQGNGNNVTGGGTELPFESIPTESGF